MKDTGYLDVYNLSAESKRYRMNNAKLKEIFKDMIEKMTGMEPSIFIDYDDETFSIRMSFDEDWLNSLEEEEYDHLMQNMPPGFHPDEWYENAQIMLAILFGADYNGNDYWVNAYADDIQDEFPYAFNVIIDYRYREV